MIPRNKRTRFLLAEEAARLMYEEQVGQYYTAKRMAARRLFGTHGAGRLSFRPVDLPSNGEIQAALLALAEQTEGENRTARLQQMRTRALEVMRELCMFSPRLIGSVATGHIRQGSDIDLQLFADDVDAPEQLLKEMGWVYERRDVQIRRGNEWYDYLHLLVEDDDPIELTVYPRSDLRVRPRSSTDGKPIQRLSSAELEVLIRREHSADTQTEPE